MQGDQSRRLNLRSVWTTLHETAPVGLVSYPPLAEYIIIRTYSRSQIVHGLRSTRSMPRNAIVVAKLAVRTHTQRFDLVEELVQSGRKEGLPVE